MLKTWNGCVVLTGAKGAGKLSINMLTSRLVRGRLEAGNCGLPGGSEDRESENGNECCLVSWTNE